MDRVTLSALVGNIVVIGLDGNVRTLAEGESPKPGELIIEELSDTSELIVEQVTPQGSSINVTEDITDLIEALAQGQDPTQLGEEFETAAGEVNGSSPQNTGAISRTGAESLASTNFETVGISGTGFSSTQLQTLFDIFQPQTPEPTDIPTPAKVVAQDISSPTVNEGEQVTFEVTLDQPTEEITNIELSLDDGSAIGGFAGEEGTDYVNSTVLVTLSDGTTQEVEVNDDGTFNVSLPIGEQSFTVSLDTLSNDVYEGPETFTLSGTTENQSTPVSGTATVVDDRPIVSISDVGNVDEGTTANFTVTLSNASEDTVEVQLALNPEETEADDLGTLEYNTGSGWVSVPEDGIVTVPAGMTEFDVRVATTPDDVYEGPEDFSVTVTGLGAVQGEDTGVATIVDDGTLTDDDRPIVSISDVGNVDEGSTANFTVTLSNASEDTVEVQLALNPEETEADDLGTLEYNTGSGWVSVPEDGIVTVPAGMTEFDVRVATTPDDVYEGPEDFSVTVTGLGAVQGKDTGVATIVDDGSGPDPDPDDDRPSVYIVEDSVGVNEGTGAEYTVKLSAVADVDVTVKLSTSTDGSNTAEANDIGSFVVTLADGMTVVNANSDGTYTIPAGQTELKVTVPTTDDDVYEGDETFTVKVEADTGVIGSDSAQGIIYDGGNGPDPDPDDDRPSVYIVEDSVGVNEGTGAEYTVKLSAVADVDVTVKLSTSTDGSNTAEANDIGSFVVTLADGMTVVNANSDGTYTIPAGQTELKVTVPTTDDDVYEGDETFTVKVEADTGVIGSDSAQGIIYDGGNGPDPDPDDDRPSVYIVEDSVGVNEGTGAEYTVKLSAVADVDVTVKLSTSTDGSNTAEANDIGSFVVTLADGMTVVNANSDGTYTIPAGQTELKVTVPTTDDDVYEGDETFTVKVEADTGVLGSDSAQGIIYDGGNGPDPDPDDDRPSVYIVEDSVGVNEGTGAEYTVKLSAVADVDVTVKLSTSTDGSNTAEANDIGSFVVTLADGMTVVNANSDGTYTIPAGQTELKVTVPTTDDDVYEGDETFTVKVEADTGVIGSDSAQGIIYDGGNGPDPDPDDDRPSVYIVEDSVGVNEGTGAEYTVKLSAVTDVDVTVKLSTSTDGSNTAEANDIGSFVVTLADGMTVVNANSDGTYTIPAGQTELKVTVPTTDDDVYEGDETFTVKVEADTGVLGSDSAQGIIYDGGNGPDPDPDDDRPSVYIVEDSVGVNEGTGAEYTVKLSAVADVDVTVKLSTSTDGSNTAEANDIGSFVVTLADGMTVVNANSDGTYTIPAGQTELKVTVPTTDDDVYEGDETFTVKVEADTGVLGSDSAQGIIYDGGNGPDPDPDDDRPSVYIVEDSVGVNEGTGAEYTVKLSAVTDVDVTVKLSTSTDGSNTAEANDIGSFVVTLADGMTVVNANSDGTYTIPAGHTELKVTVPTTDDDVYEGDETFTVKVEADTGVLGSDSAQGIIYDGGNGPDPDPDDDRPSVYIVEDSVGVNEGTGAEYTVKLSAVADVDVTVKLSTSTDGSNTAEANDIGSFVVTLADGMTVVNANSDGTYTIPAGQTELKVTVPTTDDDVYEGDETFTVKVEADTGVLGSDSAQGIIYDGGNGPDPDPDDDRPSVYIVEDSVGVNEGTGAEYTVKLSAVADVDVTVKLSTSTDGSNTAEANDIGSFVVTLADGMTVVNANSDGTYTIPAGQTELKVTVPTTDDDVYEGDETFTVKVGADTGVIGSDSAQGIIYDGGNGPDPDPDDDRPSVYIVEDSVGVNEGTGAEYTVKLSAVADVDVTVKLSTSTDGSNTAEANDIGSFVVTLADGMTVVDANSDGTYTIPAGQTELKVTVPTIPDGTYEGNETFTVMVEGDTGVLGSDSALGIIYDDDTPPSISNIINAVVSEEGLSFANPDTKPNTVPATDTTNSASFTGSFTVADPDTADVSVVLSGPSTLTSGGEVVSWVWDNSTQTLTGSTGPEASDVVATVVLTEPSNSGQGTWDYTVTLHRPLDHPQNDEEDIISFDLDISVSDGQTTTTENLNIVFEDDSPYAESVVENVNATQTNGTNVQLVLDVSGSMNRDSVTGSYDDVVTSRLDVLKSAAIALLLEYQLLGETKVQITLFDTNANILTENGVLSADNSLPNDSASIWMDIDQAIALINGLTADGNTDYDDAVRLAGDDAIWGNAEVIENANNVSYFLSDGAPNPITGRINSVEQGEWESQLEKHDVTALAYGVGTGTSTEYLEPVAYDATREVGKQIDPVVVEDISTLPAVLIQSIVAPITGVLGTDAVGASSSLFGADGGYVASVNYGGSTGITVTFDGTTITVDDSSNSTGVTTIVDNVEKRVTFVMDEKNSLVLDLNTGEYTFFASSITTETQFDFDYVLTDLDGDKVAETVTFELEPNSVQAIDDIASTPEGTPVLVDVLSNDTSGGNGETLMLADAVVDPSQGQVLIVDNQIVFVPSNNLDDGDSVRISYRTESSNGDFDIGALNVSITASTGNGTGVGSDSADVLVGTANADILLGGAGDDTLSGNAGEDIIIGGLGSDILTGGADSDVFVWTQMDTAIDTVTDFNAAEGDKLEFRDLFDDMSGPDISTLLDDFESGDYNGQVDDVSLSVTELNGNSTLTINKGGQQLEVNFDGASAADIANSLISNLEQFRE
ncbi:Calx-beta domain-containing protein [uncultured Vibrio sp.]|uniref:Calx-beta domain-containing protein n=1 Tax=uncultured Vibrio sp. TaxID=114054 RepID=UPI002AAA7E9A|nr:Calx-beta domain-containing protein [uncultured Vibrio sp.]